MGGGLGELGLWGGIQTASRTRTPLHGLRGFLDLCPPPPPFVLASPRMTAFLHVCGAVS